MTALETKRLILREWHDSDLSPFAALNADPIVMEFMGHLSTFDESKAFADRIQLHFMQHGYGLYALKLKETGEFIGFTGLQNMSFQTHFTPAVEIGWRLGQQHWNKGLATEAASFVLAHAFNALNLDEVVSFTAIQNKKSQRIMQKIGMVTNPDDDFIHPRLPADHPLNRHVLYRARKERF